MLTLAGSHTCVRVHVQGCEEVWWSAVHQQPRGVHQPRQQRQGNRCVCVCVRVFVCVNMHARTRLFVGSRTRQLCAWQISPLRYTP